MSTSTASITLAQIEAAAKAFATAREALAERVTAFNDAAAQLRRAHIPGVKRALAKVAEHQSSLSALVDDAPQLFVKPRTVVFYGVKVGLQKGKGAITWSDQDSVIKLIRKHLPDQFDTLVKTTYKPAKDALANLDAATLKRLGCQIGSTDDEVVIKAVDSEVDKLVEALLKNATEGEE